MPADDTDLETAFACTDYPKVATDDNIYIQQCATNQYAIVQFKDKHINNADNIALNTKIKVSLAPSQSTVYLQIYNQNSSEWETIDSDDATGTDTEFVLTGSITANQSDYYDVSNWVASRIYQQSV